MNMKEEQYSRIFRRKSSSSSSSFSYLFIRDFPVSAFSSGGVIITIFLAIFCCATSANAGLGPPIKDASSAGKEEVVNYKTDIVLQTCCPHQAQYNEDDGTCSKPEGFTLKPDNNGVNDDDKADENTDNETSSSGLVRFPENFVVPDFLVSRAYRNFTWDKSFRLRQQIISCPNGTIAVSVSFSPPENTPPPTGRRQLSNTVFTPVNGYLRHGFDVFYPDEYCFNKLEENELQLMVCQPDCSESRPCLPKCCDVGQVWDLSDYPDGSVRCAFGGETLWSPQVYGEVKAKKPMSTNDTRPHLIISHPRNWCVEDSTVHFLKPWLSEQKQPFRIMKSGEIWYKFDRRTWAPFTKGAYCVDGSLVKRDAEGHPTPGIFSGNYEDTVVWDCGPPLITPKALRTSQLYGISMVVAAFFLLITIVVYILLWDKQNVHGWTLLCYFISLFFMYIFYSAVNFSSTSLLQDASHGGGTMCYLIAVCAHFFFLSSFCFMSTVNFDLWWTFRALMPTGGKSKGIKKFLAYNLFSLGIPTIIVAVGITLDELYRDDPDSYIIVPEYGRKMCYLDRQYATLPYLHGPAGILLTCNLMFFTVTVYTMYRIQQSTKFATMNSSKNAKQKQSMILFLKLFLVMGLPWVFEVISSTTQKGTDIPIFFQITDMINIFQSVAIFIIFVLKTDIRNSLENKYPLFRRFILAITIRPERADSILRRHPQLRFIINPLTRSITSTRSFSTAKTTLSNGTEGSTSSRANVLGRRSDDLESTSSSSARSSPSGSLSGKRGDNKRHKSLEILEMR